MANFDIAYKKTLRAEGGYVNDSHDKGGETYMGISRRFHPNWKGWNKFIDFYNKEKQLKRGEIIDSTELEALVKEFYKLEFWKPLRCSSLYNQEVANELYDTAVNMGIYPSIKLFQKAINLLIKSDIQVDGIIGYKTLCNANQLNPSILLKTMNGLQFMRYVSICEKDSSQERFFKGWLKRI